MKIIDHLSDHPGPVNEDCWGSAGSAAWVLDGATGLGERRLLPGASDARTYVEAFSHALSALVNDGRITLQEVIRQAIMRVRNDFGAALAGSRPLPYELPSASMVIVRVEGAVLRYATLGDCKLLMRSRSGNVLTAGKSPLEDLDRKAIEQIRQLHRSGITDHQAVRSHIAETLRQHRALINTPEGYWALGFDPAASDHLCTGALRAAEIDSVLLVSDGFYDLVETFHQMSDEQLARRAQEHGLRVLLERLRAEEAADPQCLRYPRFKPGDDATAVLVAPD